MDATTNSNDFVGLANKLMETGTPLTDFVGKWVKGIDGEGNVIEGEVVSVNETEGTLTFRDKTGKGYTATPEDVEIVEKRTKKSTKKTEAKVKPPKEPKAPKEPKVAKPKKTIQEKMHEKYFDKYIIVKATKEEGLVIGATEDGKLEVELPDSTAVFAPEEVRMKSTRVLKPKKEKPPKVEREVNFEYHRSLLNLFKAGGAKKDIMAKMLETHPELGRGTISVMLYECSKFAVAAGMITMTRKDITPVV